MGKVKGIKLGCFYIGRGNDFFYCPIREIKDSILLLKYLGGFIRLPLNEEHFDGKLIKIENPEEFAKGDPMKLAWIERCLKEDKPLPK